MSLIADLITLAQQGYGWVLVLVLGVWELFAPTVIGRETALSPILRDVPERVEQLHEDQQELREDVEDAHQSIDEIQEQNKVSMQVQRAQARATDDMDERAVDDYLLKNGVTPEEFLRADGSGGDEDTNDTGE